MSPSLDLNIPILLLGLLVGWVGGFSLVDALLNASGKREVLERYLSAGVPVSGCIVEHTRTVRSSYYVFFPCLSIRTGVDYVVYYRYAYPPPRPDDLAANEEDKESEWEAEPSFHTRYFHQSDYGLCPDIEPLSSPCPVIVLPGVPTSGILQRDLDRRLAKGCCYLPHNSVPAFLAVLAGSFLSACGLLGFDAHFADLVLVACVFVPPFWLLGLPTKGRLLRLWKRRLMEDTVDDRRFQGARYNCVPTGTAPTTASTIDSDKMLGREDKTVEGSVQMSERGKTSGDDIPEVV